MTDSSRRITVAWNGLPAYAARLLQAAQLRMGVEFPVLGTRPDVPIEGMESILGESLKWLEPDIEYTWAELGLIVPDVFIHTGWRYPHFISLADEVRANGGKVIGMFDNCWKGNLRQLLGGWYFRLFLRRKYAGAWVPGSSANKLARHLGFAEGQIYRGMYGADPNIFKCTKQMDARPKRILFVGRLTHRKGVLELVEAFRSCQGRFPGWELYVVGEGELAQQIESRDGVKCLPFMQPEQVAELMNESRIFALASREEHWGLVVHEAALCGCALLLQSKIGAAEDLGAPKNSKLFEVTSVAAIHAALSEMMQWDGLNFRAASDSSCKLAEEFGPAIWAECLETILKEI